MKRDLDRREFFKIGGAVTAGAAVGLGIPLLPIYESNASGPADDADLAEIRWGMVIDVRKCPEDCSACTDACRQENNVAFHDDPAFDIHWIRKASVRRRVKGAKAVGVPLLCNHCGDPPCALVCPVQAPQEKGDVYWIDPDICLRCGFCPHYCPVSCIEVKEQ